MGFIKKKSHSKLSCSFFVIYINVKPQSNVDKNNGIAETLSNFRIEAYKQGS